MALRCFISDFVAIPFHAFRLRASSLLCLTFSLFLNPSALLSSSLPFFSLLPSFDLCVYFLLAFLFIFFSFSSKAPGFLMRVSYYSLLETTMSSSKDTYTLQKPEGLLSLIETNGEITQTAVPNNSLHSLLSGSMVRKWEPRGRGCWTQ